MKLTSLKKEDLKIYDLIQSELDRQRKSIRLIPSENYVSKAVLEATGSILTNKYSEGYIKKRYYEGQEYIDQIEEIACSRACKLFGADHANVQPYSGSPANLAAYSALIEPGEKIMGMNLFHGGHLTHGFKVSFTSRFFQSVQYKVDKKTKLLNYDEINELARKEKPKIIICGATAYPRVVNFKKFREIADNVGAYLVADIAHIAGLIAAGEHPSPVPYADVITTTTHKTLRGPRGAMIMCKKDYAAQVDKAVFPGLQGGPHNNTTAAIATALNEATQDNYKDYAKQIIKNAKVLSDELIKYDFTIVTGGTDNHLLLIDMSNKDITGRKAAKTLACANIVCNFNTVPFDKKKPFDPSGIRLGTPAITSRGMKEEEMKKIAYWINEVVESIENKEKIKEIGKEVEKFCSQYNMPGID